MNSTFEVFNESGSVIATSTSNSPPPEVESLVRKAQYFIDTTHKDVFAFIPGRTSLLRGGSRSENLYFHYRDESEQSEDPTRDFRIILDRLSEPSDQGMNQLGTGRSQSALATEIENSDLADGDWDFEREDPGTGETRLPWLVDEAEPDLPNLTHLKRRAFHILLDKGHELRLGMASRETTAAVMKHIVNGAYDVSVGVPKEGQSLDAADIVLVPGQKKDYSPLDDNTRKSLAREQENQLENYAETQKNELQSKLDDILNSDLGITSKYLDFCAIRARLQSKGGNSPQFNTNLSSDFVTHFQKVQSSSDVPSDIRNDIEGTVLSKLKKEISNLETELKQQDVNELKKYVDRIDKYSSKDVLDQYETFSDLVDIVESQNPKTVSENHPNGHIRDFARKLEDVRDHNSRLQDIAVQVESEISDYIDRKLKDTRETIQTTAVENVEKHIDRLHRGSSLSIERRYQILTQLKRVSRPGRDLENLRHRLPDEQTPDEVLRKISANYDAPTDPSPVEGFTIETWRIQNSNALQENDRETIFEEIRKYIDKKRRSLADRRRRELENQLKSKRTGILKGDIPLETKLTRIREAMEACRAFANGSEKTRSTSGNSLVSTVNEVRESDALSKKDKKGILNELTDELNISRDNLLEDRKNKYSNRIDNYIREVSNEVSQFGVNGRLAEYDTIEKILNNRGRGQKKSSDETAPQTRNIRKEVRKLDEDEHLDSATKSKIVKDALNTLEKERQGAKKIKRKPAPDSATHKRRSTQNSSGRSSLSRLPSRPSNRFSGRMIAGFAFIFLLGAVTTALLGMVVDPLGTALATGSLDGENQPLTITSPEMDREVAEEELVVAGATTVGSVNVSATNTDTDRVYSNSSEEENQSYSVNLGELPPGQYLVRTQASSPQGLLERQRAIVFLGTNEPEITLEKPNASENLEGTDIEVEGTTTFERVTVTLRDSQGSIVTQTQTEVTNGTFNSTVEAAETGEFIVEISPTNVSGPDYQRSRIVMVNAN